MQYFFQARDFIRSWCNSARSPRSFIQIRDPEPTDELFAQNLTQVVDRSVPAGSEEFKTRERAIAIQGKKRGLFVGCNYIGTSSQLEGCISDAQNSLSYFSRKCGLNEYIQLDDRTHARPTKANIMGAIKFILNRCESGDTFIWHQSSHGTQVRDTNGDEADGMDEAVCPLDYQTAGMITDDALRVAIIDYLIQNKKKVRVIAVGDLCHSASLLDLRHQWDTSNNILVASTTRPQSVDLDVIYISGCRDSGTSTDARVGGQAYGALTYNLIKLLDERPVITYRQLMLELNTRLKPYNQVSNLSSEMYLDLDSQVKW